MSTLKAMESNLKRSYEKQNLTLMVISYEIYEMTMSVRSSIYLLLVLFCEQQLLSLPIFTTILLLLLLLLIFGVPKCGVFKENVVVAAETVVVVVVVVVVEVVAVNLGAVAAAPATVVML